MSRLVAHDDHSVFTFSLPLPAIIPLARDPNLQPLDLTSLDLKDVTATSRLTTLNADVQNHIMSALPTSDLSALMRTCRYLSEAALLPLCARSFAELDTIKRVTSFHKFLRVNSGPSSRTPFIKAIWLDVRYDPCFTDQVTNEYLAILRHCKQVRRLRVASWYPDIDPTLLFHVIATSLLAMEEFDLWVIPSRTVSDKDLRKLSRLPLRKLRLTGHLLHIPDSLEAIRPLARTLVELSEVSLDLLRAPPCGSFPGVRRLGVYCHHADTFVESLTSTFPRVTHLQFSGHGSGALLEALDSGLRERNRQRWQEDFPKAWPTLQSVWAKDMVGLCASGLVHRVAHLSVPADHIYGTSSDGSTAMLNAVLADLCPGAVELRIDLISFYVVSSIANVLDESLRAILQSCPRLILRHEGLGSDENLILRLGGLGSDEYDRRSITTIFDALEKSIAEHGTLTHLLLRHVFRRKSTFQPDPTRIAALAQASKTVRWIGVEVDGVLRCWKVAHSKEGSAGQDTEITTLVNMSEAEGRHVLATEKMDEFRD